MDCNCLEDVNYETQEDVGKEEIRFRTLITEGEEIEIPEDILERIPYLSRLFSGRDHDQEKVENNEFKPVLLKIILKYLKGMKKYKLIACLPVDGDIIHLFHMCEELELDPLIDPIIKLTRKPSRQVKTQKELVDYFYFLYLLYQDKGRVYDNPRLRYQIFNTVRYVLETGNGCLKPRARYHLKKMILKYFSDALTDRQVERIRSLNVEGDLDLSDTECSGVYYDDFVNISAVLYT